MAVACIPAKPAPRHKLATQSYFDKRIVLPRQDTIPDGYRLLSCDEFLAHRDACLDKMDDWTICLLTGAA